MRRYISVLFWGLFVSLLLALEGTGIAQNAQNQTNTFSPIVVGTKWLPYRIRIKQYDFPEGILPILQSYVVGQYDGKWLILEGRTNGLHNFTDDGFKNFPPDKQNLEVWVIDPSSTQSWYKSLKHYTSGLSQEQVDSLSLTNTQYYQDGCTLYIMGGYGYDNTQNKFMTYDKLTAIDVPGLMDWVMSESDDTAASHIRQIADPIFRVTGGDMFKMGNRTFLVFGQDFEGPYNPTANGTYTKQVRSFKIIDDGTFLGIEDTFQTQPVDAYRRRDLNIVPVIRPKCSFWGHHHGWQLEEGLVALSGVFTLTAGAWTVPVEISERGIPSMRNPNSPWTFKQGMNNYHSANVSLFSEQSKNMYVLLMGGITLNFYDRDNKEFVYFPSSNPDFLPWTSQVTTIKINPFGQYTQFLMDEEFPDIRLNDKRIYFGAEAEFIPAQGLETYENGVLKLDRILKHGKQVIGYVFGGIATDGFAVGIDDTTTNASNLIFEISIEPRYYWSFPFH